MDKFEQMVETIEEAEDMVECKECFDLFPKAECTKMDHGYICPTCGREQQSQDFSDVSFTDITTDLYDHEFPDVREYDSEFGPEMEERQKEYHVDDIVDALIKDEYDAIESYELADEMIQEADVEEDMKDDLLDAIEHIKKEEEEHIDEINAAAGRVEADPEDEDKKDDDSEEDSDSEDEDDDKDEDDKDSDKENDDKDEDEDEDDKEKNEDLTEAAPSPEMVEGEEILDEKKESVFDKIWKPVNESLWVCKFKDAEIGKVSAETEEEALEKMQKEFPEYNYGEYDGCFEVCQEAGCEKHDAITHPEDDKAILNEDTAVNELTQIYLAALNVANKKGVGQVFGYARADDEEFVPIELVDVSDLDTIEADLEATYPDFGYAYVAYPQGSLEEKLFESIQLNEGPMRVLKDLGHAIGQTAKHLATKDSGKILNKFFNNGYSILFFPAKQGAKLETPAEHKEEHETLDQAITAADKYSKEYPEFKVYVYANEIDVDGLTPRLTRFADIKNGYGALIAAFRNGTQTSNNAKQKAEDLIKILRDNKDLVKTIGKTAATSKSEDPVAAEEGKEDLVTLKKEAQKALGSPKGADGYTAESYEDYKKAYKQILSAIIAVASKEDLEKIDIETRRADAEKLLKLATDDSKADTATAAPESSKKTEANRKIKDALKASGMSKEEIQQLFKSGVLPKIRKALIGEGLELKDLTEDLDEDEEEETEETVECVWCNHLVPKGECRKEVDMGWLCDRCEQAINSRGETLTFEQ